MIVRNDLILEHGKKPTQKISAVLNLTQMLSASAIPVPKKNSSEDHEGKSKTGKFLFENEKKLQRAFHKIFLTLDK